MLRCYLTGAWLEARYGAFNRHMGMIFSTPGAGFVESVADFGGVSASSSSRTRFQFVILLKPAVPGADFVLFVVSASSSQRSGAAVCRLPEASTKRAQRTDTAEQTCF